MSRKESDSLRIYFYLLDSFPSSDKKNARQRRFNGFKHVSLLMYHKKLVLYYLRKI
jgi:hypothetical protein